MLRVKIIRLHLITGTLFMRTFFISGGDVQPRRALKRLMRALPATQCVRLWVCGPGNLARAHTHILTHNHTWGSRFLSRLSACKILTLCGWWLAAGVCGAARGAESVPLFPANSYVALGTPSTLRFSEGSPFTVEGWVNLDSLPPLAMLYSKNNGRESPYSYMFGLKDAGWKMAVYVGMDGSPGDVWLEVSLPSAISTNRWHHLAYAYDGRFMSFFLDGACVGGHPCRFADHEAHSVKLGGYADGTDIPGRISDVRVWNHAREAAQIRAFMNRRLNGQEPGLLGYWPLNEGAGRVVRDGTLFNDGTLAGDAEWRAAEGLNLIPVRPDSLFGGSFALMDPVTGSTRFTSSNQVTVAEFTIPDGCDLYQITPANGSGGPIPNAWQPTNTAPEMLTFPRPLADTNIVFCAWFTNLATASLPWYTEGSMGYTTVSPVPVVRSVLNIERLPGQNVVIHGRDLDAGSSGGEAPGHRLGIDRFEAQSVRRDADQTPDAPVVTLAAAGVYPLRLQVRNEAGRLALSTGICQVVVSDASSVTNAWLGDGGDDQWETAANWSAGVPTDGQVVAIQTGSVVRVSGPTALLSAFVLGEGRTLVMAGWNSPLRATDMRIYGVVAHATNDAAGDDWGAWKPQHRILLEGRDILVAAEACLDANGRGYRPGQGPGSTIGLTGGGGHAGHGGEGMGVPGGVPYGDRSHPELPGSGGGPHPNGGAGGGAIRIEASGLLTLHGTVRANGQHGAPTQGPGGAGGSIELWCRTLAGSSNGWIQVDGGHGDQQGGGGSGGRIAVRYDPVRQAALADSRPAIRFTGIPGNQAVNEGMPIPAGMGTLDLPDSLLVDGQFTDGRLRYVQVSIAGRTRWELDEMTLNDCVVGVAEGMDLVVTNDLVLNRNSRIFLYAKPTNISDDEPGSALRVGGNLVLNGGSWIVPAPHPTNGVSVRIFVKKNIRIAPGCGIDSDRRD